MTTWQHASSIGPRPRSAETSLGPDPGPALWPAVRWLTSLAAAPALLWWAGTATGGPAVTDPGSWGAWWASTDPTTAVIAVLRLLGLGIAWYLVGVTAVALAGHLLRMAALVHLSDILSVGPAAPAIRHALAVTLAVGALASTTPTDTTTAPSPTGTTGTTAASVAAGASAASVAAGASAEPAPAWSAAPHVEDIRPARTPAPPIPAPSTDLREVAPMAAIATEAATSRDDHTPAKGVAGHDVRRDRTTVIEPGDHLWALASTDVAAALGRPPSDAEIAEHWVRLVEANAPHLLVPGNPDILVPGQEALLPAVTP